MKKKKKKLGRLFFLSRFKSTEHVIKKKMDGLKIPLHVHLCNSLIDQKLNILSQPVDPGGFDRAPDPSFNKKNTVSESSL